MTITSGTVPANPTRRFKNWKVRSQDSAMKVRRRNFLRSPPRGNHGFGGGFFHLIGPSDSRPRLQPSCLWPRLGFFDGVKSRTRHREQDGTSRASLALHKWNRMSSEQRLEL